MSFWNDHGDDSSDDHSGYVYPAPPLKVLLDYRDIDPLTEPIEFDKGMHGFLTKGETRETPVEYQLVYGRRADYPLGSGGGWSFHHLRGQKVQSPDGTEMAKQIRCLCLTTVDCIQAYYQLVPLDCLDEALEKRTDMMIPQYIEFARAVARWQYGFVTKQDRDKYGVKLDQLIKELLK